MRTSIRLVLATALVGLWAGAATADVDAYATIYKDKDVTFTVNYTITKDITVNVTYDSTLAGSAEADTLVNQTNHGNVVGASKYNGQQFTIGEIPDGTGPSGPRFCNYCTGLEVLTTQFQPFDVKLTADINNSINNNTGIVNFNQDVGANNNQANSVAFALSDSDSVFADAEAQMDQKNYWNAAIQVEDDPMHETKDEFTDADKTRSSSITNSINGNQGIVNVNQDSGSNNNQANALAMTVGLSTDVALAEADLGQENCGNVIAALNTYKTDLIDNSMLSNSGVVSVNQTAGNNNNQGTNIAFSALTSTAVVYIPGAGNDL